MDFLQFRVDAKYKSVMIGEKKSLICNPFQCHGGFLCLFLLIHIQFTMGIFTWKHPSH